MSEQPRLTTREKIMNLVYVFNYFQPSGYLFRAPEFVARMFVKLSRGTYDYAPTEAGL